MRPSYPSKTFPNHYSIVTVSRKNMCMLFWIKLINPTNLFRLGMALHSDIRISKLKYNEYIFHRVCIQSHMGLWIIRCMMLTAMPASVWNQLGSWKPFGTTVNQYVCLKIYLNYLKSEVRLYKYDHYSFLRIQRICLIPSDHCINAIFFFFLSYWNIHLQPRNLQR